jgi:hypothetical protein
MIRHKTDPIVPAITEGREASFSLSQHLKDLLTQKDPDFYQGQGCREQLDEGCRLVEHLVCKLSTGEVATGSDYSKPATRSPAHKTLHISTSDLFMNFILSLHSWACQKFRTTWMGRQRKNTSG